MNNNLESLKKKLKIKLSEHMMFNNTLAEMIEKNSSTTAIKQMEDEIDNLEKDIKKLQEDIRINSPKKNENASLYNHIKKPTLAKSVKIGKTNKTLDEKLKDIEKTSFYDAIEKSDFARYDTPYNTLKKDDTYAAKAFGIKKNGNWATPYDEAISANRFLVRFEGNVKVPEYYVRKVSFSPSDRKEIFVQIFDFLTEDNRPVITEFNNQNIPFRISIDHLDPTGRCLYTERYHGCNVMEIMRSDLAYNLDEKAVMELNIIYSDVSYETAH